MKGNLYTYLDFDGEGKIVKEETILKGATFSFKLKSSDFLGNMDEYDSDFVEYKVAQ